MPRTHPPPWLNHATNPRQPSETRDVRSAKIGRLTRRPTISLSVSAYTQPTCTTRFCASASDAVAGCAGN